MITDATETLYQQKLHPGVLVRDPSRRAVRLQRKGLSAAARRRAEGLRRSVAAHRRGNRRTARRSKRNGCTDARAKTGCAERRPSPRSWRGALDFAAVAGLGNGRGAPPPWSKPPMSQQSPTPVPLAGEAGASAQPDARRTAARSGDHQLRLDGRRGERLAGDRRVPGDGPCAGGGRQFRRDRQRAGDQHRHALSTDWVVGMEAAARGGR